MAAVLLGCAAMLTACGDNAADRDTSALTTTIADPDRQYDTYEWTDLLPDSDLQALLNPPEFIFDIEEGSADDTLLDPLKAPATEAETAYEKALISTSIRPELDGKDVRIAGFIVPLEFDTDQSVRQFFFVPYFGACIHVPPPPPNQLILVDSEQKLNVTDIYQPYWIQGELRTTLHENDIATSAYTMNLHHVELYQPPQN